MKIEQIEAEIYIADRYKFSLEEKLKDKGFLEFTESGVQRLYQSIYKLEKLQGAQQFITENPERAKEWLTTNIDYIKRDLLRGSLSKNSTNPMANLAHEWQLECSQQLLDIYENTFKQLP